MRAGVEEGRIVRARRSEGDEPVQSADFCVVGSPPESVSKKTRADIPGREDREIDWIGLPVCDALRPRSAVIAGTAQLTTTTKLGKAKRAGIHFKFTRQKLA